MQVSQDSNSLVSSSFLWGGRVENCCFVEWQALAQVDGALNKFHHLDWCEKHCGSVVSDHTLCHSIRSFRRSGSSDLESRNAHDVGVEWLAVLRSQSLIGRCAPSAN